MRTDSDLWRRPSPALATLSVAVAVLLWGGLRLVVFADDHFPLTYVLPLLLAVWTRRPADLWVMAALFVGMTFVKFGWILPAEKRVPATLVVTLINIVVGALIVRVVLRLRGRLALRLEEIARQNAELEAQAEELAQQNEEIRVQSEELAQQAEEIEAQAEELTRQNEELQLGNQRLAAREDVLHSVLLAARSGVSDAALTVVCERTLSALGRGAGALGVYDSSDTGLRRVVHATAAGATALPPELPAGQAFAQLVLERAQTAYVDDLTQRPDLAAGWGRTAGSLLASPLRIGGQARGLVVALAEAPRHWTEDQFVLLEWVAAQCGIIAEAIQVQRALEQRTEVAEAASRAKDHFLATLSHELRTPLMPVLAVTSSLAEDARLPADVRADVALIQRNVAVQSRLIDDLLDVARIARGQIDLDLKRIAVAEWLREAVAVVAPDLQRRQQVLALEFTLPAGCAIVGDGARLQQVVWNLLKNGSKFSAEGGTLRLRATVRAGSADADPGRLVLEVIDTGGGIATADLERIFLPFEQVAAHRSRGGNSGLGLGLSIAREIVVQHGGTIRASSAGLDQGAVFTVELPLAAAAPAPLVATLEGAGPAPAGAPGDTATRPARHLLLVEDHEDTGRVLVRQLQRRGFVVMHARSVAEATHCWETAPAFDLILSDLGLPDGSGLELMRHLRALRPELRGICMSGYGMDSDLAASQAAGFTEHLIKPVGLPRLQAAIERVLSQPVG